MTKRQEVQTAGKHPCQNITLSKIQDVGPGSLRNSEWLDFSLELSLTECGAEKNSDRALVFCPGKLPQQKEMHSQYRIAVGFSVHFKLHVINYLPIRDLQGN